MTRSSGRIFVVEDEALISMEIQDRLQRLGYDVVGAARKGEEALAMIPAAEPDVVLMDISLAGEMSGVDVALELRRTSGTPVVFLSAYSDDALVRRAMETEPFGYLVKPFEEREVHATIATALRKARLQRELHQSRDRLLDRSFTPIIRTLPDGRFLSANPAACRFHGYDSEQELLDAVGDIGAEIYVNADDRLRVVEQVMSTGQVEGFECEVYRHRGRERRWARQNIWSVRDEDGEFLFIEGYWEDITEEQRADELLRESEARFQAQFRHTPHPVYVFRFDGGEGALIDYNEAALEATEGGVASLVGLSPERVFADRPDLTQEVLACLRTGEAKRRECDYRLRQRAGLRRIEFTFSYAPPNLVLVHTIDITERREAERMMRDMNAELERRVERRTAQLVESERFSRGILDSIGANVAVLDENGRIVSSNAAWRDFGSSRGLTAPTHDRNYLEICDRAASAGGDEAPFARAAAQGIRDVIRGARETFSLEYPCAAPEGTSWFLCRVSRFSSDGPLRVVITHDDVTEVRRAREEAAEKDRLFASLVEVAPVGVFRTDVEGNCQVTNALWQALTGLTEADSNGRGWLAGVHPDDRTRIDAAWQSAIETGGGFQEEYRYCRLDGGTTWVIGQAVPIRNGGPGAAGFIGAVTDISARKRTEEVMETLSVDLARLTGAEYPRAAAQRLAELLGADAATVARVTGRDRTRIRTVAMVRDGMAEPDAVFATRGTPCAELLAGEAGDVLLIEDGLAERYPDFAAARELGMRSYAAAALVNERGETFGNIFVMFRTPLTDTAFTVSALKLFAVAVGAQMTQESNARKYKDLFEFAPDALVMVEGNGEIAYANRHAEVLFGWRRSEMIGQPVEMLVPPEHREIHDGYRRNFSLEPGNRRMAAERPGLAAVRKDGSIFPVEINLAPIGTDDEALTAAAVRDVTERRRMESELAQSTKIEAIGNLSGGIAHDYNNYLAVIIGNLDLIAESGELGPESGTLVSMALDAAERGAELSRSLLAFSRRQPLQPVPTDINARVEAVVKLIRRMLGEAITVSVYLESGLPQVRIDPAQLDSSIVNLATNARDAMGSSGTLAITTRRLQVPTGAPARGPRPGEYVEIGVTDTGPGIPEDIREKVFEPFFTTKPPGQGTGLGLSMVYGFVRQSGGQVELLDRPGGGAEVRLLLPALSQQVAFPEQAGGAPADGPASCGERILVVEDNANLRRAVTASISSLGYRVSESPNADAALDMLEADPSGFDLVFSDVIMPGRMDGFALANLIHHRFPGVRVLLTSGYPGHLAEVNGDGPIRSRILAKPYRKEQLARALREAVEGRCGNV